MKIISKYKEYYDYFMGIYGVDELMVYDRREFDLFKFEHVIDHDDYQYIKFAICNKYYGIYTYKGKIYHSPEDFIELNRILEKDKKELIKYKIGKSFWGYKAIETIEEAKKHHDNINGNNTEVNKKLRQPVLVQIESYQNAQFSCEVKTSSGRETTKYFGIPYLTEFKAAAWMPAEDIYREISNFMGWLKDNPPIPDKMTNKEKILSHGFDMKKSFRHRKND